MPLRCMTAAALAPECTEIAFNRLEKVIVYHYKRGIAVRFPEMFALFFPARSVPALPCARASVRLRTSSALLLVAAMMAGGTPALAQDAAAPADPHSHQSAPADDFHNDDAIVVTGKYVKQLDVLAGVSVIGGEKLAQDVRPQIGDSLTRLPGVSATSFSPGASRPVLRGFQGERVRVLTDGIGSIDVSNTSADHAVTIDPLTAERIEVLRGPAVLLYGSSAMGGAVNVLDRRIPRSMADHAVHVDALATYGSAAKERSAGASLDVPLGSQFMWHVDGTYRKTGDLRVGGHVYSPQFRAALTALGDEAMAEGEPEEAAEAYEAAGLRGRVRNSATETKSAGTGIALINDGGSLGISVGYYDTDYGIPSRPALAHHHEEEGGHDHGEVTIGMKQWRADLRGEVKVGSGLLEAIRVRAGFADYQHTEYEGGEVGTTFYNQGIEGRIELAQRERGGWNGTSGVHYFSRDMRAVGEEAFVPPNMTEQLGLFTLQEWELGNLGVEGALRYEHSKVSAQTLNLSRGFDTLSGALGLSYKLHPDIKVGANVTRAVRAPSAEELYAEGIHVATQSYVRGNAALGTEKSWGGELYLRVDTPDFDASLTGYGTRFDNYIYDSATGATVEDFPVFQYVQRDATYYGFEAEASWAFAHSRDWTFLVDGVADYVHASIRQADGSKSPVPRIPPLRLLGGLEAQSEHLDGRVEVERSFAQNRTGAFETPTAAFTLVNASLAWRPMGKAGGVTLMLSGNNLFDVEARRAASFTKDYVPMAGRDIRATVRLSF